MKCGPKEAGLAANGHGLVIGEVGARWGTGGSPCRGGRGRVIMPQSESGPRTNFESGPNNNKKWSQKVVQAHRSEPSTHVRVEEASSAHASEVRKRRGDEGTR